MTTNIDFRKGVLFIRIRGSLIKNKINKFENEVLPIVLGLGSRYITVNLFDVNYIDKSGVESLIKLSSIVNKWEGKVAICEINDNIKSNLKDTDIFDYCFKTKNELTSLGVFSIWA